MPQYREYQQGYILQDDRNEPTWIFGYGSLMWQPGFPYLEAHPALLEGYHRALCIYSHRYRGTPEKPGLVLGLDRGGSCRGRAFLLRGSDVADVMAYLHDREMITNAYDPTFLEVALDDGRTARAYNFIVRNDHPQYTGRISRQEAARLVLQGRGERGTAMEYLQNTLDHLAEIGIVEEELEKICEAAKKRLNADSGTAW